MDGHSTDQGRCARYELRRAPAIALTGYGGNQDIEKSLAAGFNRASEQAVFSPYFLGQSDQHHEKLALGAGDRITARVRISVRPLIVRGLVAFQASGR